MRLRKWIISFCFLLLSLSSFGNDGELRMSVLSDQPVFTLNIDAKNVKFFIDLNGVSVFSENVLSSQVSVEIPVNHWFHPAYNKLSILALPQSKGNFQSGAYISVELHVHGNGNRSSKHNVASLVFDSSDMEDPAIKSSNSGKYSSSRNFSLDDEGDVNISSVSHDKYDSFKGGIVISRTIDAKISFPVWAYFLSDELPDYYTVEDDVYYSDLEVLVKKHNDVLNSIASNDVSQLVSLFRERNIETDVAFYLEGGSTEEGIKSDVSALSEESLTALPITADVVSIIPEDNRRLVKLVRSGGEPAIVFNFPEGEGSIQYPVYFRRQDGDWILTR